MWRLYDRLIALMPDDQFIMDIKQTNRWIIVSSNYGIGSAMKFEKEEVDLKKYLGANLKEVSHLVKSWNNHEASLGLAAINSYINQAQKIETSFLNFNLIEQDALTQIQNMSNKKVGMIGHFPYLERYPETKEFTTVFELNPREGDLPSAAAEYLLPEMDVVFITASTIVNKTLPRLLELSKKANVILMGASCPLTSVLFEEGVTQIGGTLYEEPLEELVEKKLNKRLPLSKIGKPILAIKNGELK